MALVLGLGRDLAARETSHREQSTTEQQQRPWFGRSLGRQRLGTVESNQAHHGEARRGRLFVDGEDIGPNSRPAASGGPYSLFQPRA